MEAYSPTYVLNIGGKETEVTALSGQMRYLPVPVVAGDTESAITVEARVKYNRNNKSAYSEKDAEAVSYSFETLPSPSISVDKELIGKQFPETPDKHWRFDAVMKLNLGLPGTIEPFAVAGYSVEKDLGVSDEWNHHIATKGCADHDYHGFVLDDAVTGFGYTSGDNNWCELGIEKGYIPVYVEALDYKSADWVYTQGIDLNLIPTVHVYYPFIVAEDAADRVYPDQPAPAPSVSRVAMSLPASGTTVLYERPSTLTVSFKDAATTGITGIFSAVGDPAEYFDMQGRRVANPAPGIYIVRRGSDVRREIVR